MNVYESLTNSMLDTILTSRDFPIEKERARKIKTLEINGRSWISNNNISRISKIYFTQGYIISLIKDLELNLNIAPLELNSIYQESVLQEIELLLYQITSININFDFYSTKSIQFLYDFFKVTTKYELSEINNNFKIFIKRKSYSYIFQLSCKKLASYVKFSELDKKFVQIILEDNQCDKIEELTDNWLNKMKDQYVLCVAIMNALTHRWLNFRNIPITCDASELLRLLLCLDAGQLVLEAKAYSLESKLTAYHFWFPNDIQYKDLTQVQLDQWLAFGIITPASSTQNSTVSSPTDTSSFKYESFLEYSRLSTLEKFSDTALNILKKIHNKDNIAEIAKTKIHPIENFLDVNLDNLGEIIKNIGMVIPPFIKNPVQYYYDNISDYIPVFTNTHKKNLVQILENPNNLSKLNRYTDDILLNYCTINYNSRKELIKNITRVIQIGDLFFIPENKSSSSLKVAYGKLSKSEILYEADLLKIFKTTCCYSPYKNPKATNYFTEDQLSQLKLLLQTYEHKRAQKVILKI